MNLAAINSALASTAVTAAQLTSPADIVTLVASYNTVLTCANGNIADTGTRPQAADYTNIGVTLGSAASGNSSKSTLTLKNLKDFGLVPTQVTVALPKAPVATAIAKSNTEVAALFPNGDDLLSTTCAWISYSLLPVYQ
jgi:hypothetical protein